MRLTYTPSSRNEFFALIQSTARFIEGVTKDGKCPREYNQLVAWYLSDLGKHPWHDFELKWGTCK